jgi:dihydrodipicolinate synthase/N-acetylneuraminate lyase
VCPQPCIDLHDAVLARDLPRAQAIYGQLKPLPAITAEAGPEPLGAGIAGRVDSLRGCRDENF